MTPVILAALAAVTATFGAWEALAAIEPLTRAGTLRRVLWPLRAAGREGREPTPPERRRLAMLGAAALLAGGWLLAGLLAGLVLAAAGPALAARLVTARRRRWRRALADEAPAAARALADALSAGHSIRGGLQQLGRAGGLRRPLGGELGDAARRLALGERTEAVLERLRRRADAPAWDTLVAAILLQRDAGGDLVALLRSIAAAQEAARRSEADAHGMTAQSRATARLVAGLPFAGLALGELIHPGTLLALLADARSRLLVVAALALGGMAFAVVGRLARTDGA